MGQNLAGLENVWRDIQREATEGLRKTIRVHFVAANVPDLDDEQRILRRQLQTFVVRLGIKWIDAVVRRYENLNLLEQSVFTLDRPRTRLAGSYRGLLRTLLKDNLADRDGVMIPGRPIRAVTPIEDYAVDFQQAEINRLYKIARHFKDDIEVLTKLVSH